jgi:hypothetical protein
MVTGPDRIIRAIEGKAKRDFGIEIRPVGHAKQLWNWEQDDQDLGIKAVLSTAG